MKAYPIAIAALVLAAACGNSEVPEDMPVAPAPPPVEDVAAAPGPVGIETAWVAEGFSAPEGAARAADGAYFISNVAGEGRGKDGEGWISRVSPDGEVLEAQWASGLDAPKGMAVLDGELYVADIDQIRVIDAETGAISVSLPVEGADFLNDVTVWDGKVYVSDSGAGRIYVLTGTAVDVWLEDERLAGVNGLLGDGGRMLVATMGGAGGLWSAAPDGTLTPVASGLASADGIGLVSGGFLVSGWPGQIWYVSEGGEVTELYNVLGQELTQNDLTVFDGSTVIVPNWRKNTVTAWTVTE